MNRLLLLSFLCFNLVIRATAQPTVTIAVSPATAQVAAGTQQQFVASVTGSSDSIVIWHLSGPGCAGFSCGSITSSGLFTAPASAPNPPTVTVTAIPLADLSKSASATVTLATPSVSVSVTPGTTQVSAGTWQQFRAVVNNAPNQNVIWSISGSGCGSYNCGAITGNGFYIAPSVVTGSLSVTLTATSTAYQKAGSATISLVSKSGGSVTVSPGTAQLTAGAQQMFSSLVTGTSNGAVTWSVSGAGCTPSICGTISQQGLYNAPGSITSSTTVTVTAASIGLPGTTGTASITLLPAISVTVAPTSATVGAGSQQQFNATVADSGNASVIWSLSGAACGTGGCGSITASGLYTAPNVVPNVNAVTVIARSSADASKYATSSVTIANAAPIKVTVAPASLTLGTGSQQQFSAVVTGSTNQAVSWKVSGIGCYGSSCGTINASGLYTAPALTPNPSAVTISAVSQANSSGSGSASVYLTTVVSISMTPGSVQVTTGSTQQFSATVTGTNNTTVNWSVRGPACSGPRCGSISASGLYTAPTNVPSNPSVTVSASAQSDPSKTATASVTLALPVIVSVAPGSTSVAVGDQQQFSASVTGTSNTAVTWSASGVGCSGSGCGSVDSSGLYTAPSSMPNPATVKITATSLANPTKSAAATISVTPPSDNRLTGQYAFLFRGFDSLGAYQSAGTFTADGNGNMLNGVEDVNRIVGGVTGLPFTGTYKIGANGRGTFSIVSSQGTATFNLAVNLSGQHASFIESDASGIRGSGVLELQNASAFANYVLSGAGYTLSLTGGSLFGGRIAAIGSVFPNGAGGIVGNSLDVNSGGSLASYNNFPGTYNVGSNGRGTATLNIFGFGSGVFHFSIYVISQNEVIFFSTDPLNFVSPMFSGKALRQSGAPFLLSSFQGSPVFSEVGMLGTSSDAAVGQMVFDGKGTAVMNFDENNGGSVSIANTYSGAYTVQPNGRALLTLMNHQLGLSKTVILYAISPNSAYVLEEGGAAKSGKLNAQLSAPPFETSSIAGNFTFATDAAAIAATTQLSGIAIFDGGGLLSGFEDASQVSKFSPNLLLIGDYYVSQVSNNGRAVIITSSPGPQTWAIWQVSGTTLVGLDVDVSNANPTTFSFEQ